MYTVTGHNCSRREARLREGHTGNECQEKQGIIFQ